MNKVKLKDVSILITKGTTPTTVGGEFKSNGINFVKSESITESKYLDKSLFAFIDKETDEKLKRSRIKTNDLLFSIAGAYLGKISKVNEEDVPANTNQAVGIVRLDLNQVDVDYIYYYFSQRKINEYINKLSSQSSQPNLNLDLLGNLEFDKKPLSTQQKIAAVLSALDDKIELNNKINGELEAIAKTLYDYWFVQFDFPNQEGKPYKSSGGKMVYNPILKREIPEGWEVKNLEELLIEFTKGITTSYVEKSNLINLNQKVNKGFKLDRQYFKYLDESIEIPQSKFATKGDILINSLGQGTLGRVHYFIDNENNIVVDQHLFILRANKNLLYPTYLYNVLSSKPYQLQIERQITGSTGMLMLNASNLKDMPIICPNIEVSLLFEKSVSGCYDKISINDKQNQ